MRTSKTNELICDSHGVALRAETNPALELKLFLVWERRIRLYQPGNRKMKTVDSVRP